MENSDKGTQLKSIGIQMQNLGTQLQNTGLQLSIMNINYDNQIQNIGIQILNFSFKIFDIGIEMSNINHIKDPNEFQINNMMNKMNELMEREIKNNNINNIKQNYDKSLINITFQDIRGFKENIIISYNKTIKELINLYLLRIGENHEHLKKVRFLYNGKLINPNETMRIIEFGITGGIIIVEQYRNLMGGSFIILKVISENAFNVRLNFGNLNIYLIKYFEIIGKSEMKKQIQAFENIDILDFFKKFNEIPD